MPQFLAYQSFPTCEEAFGTFPVAVCHEWNTIAHLNDYEGDPEAKPFTREQLQLFCRRDQPSSCPPQRAGTRPRGPSMTSSEDNSLRGGHPRVMQHHIDLPTAPSQNERHNP